MKLAEKILARCHTACLLVLALGSQAGGSLWDQGLYCKYQSSWGYKETLSQKDKKKDSRWGHNWSQSTHGTRYEWHNQELHAADHSQESELRFLLIMWCYLRLSLPFYSFSVCSHSWQDQIDMKTTKRVWSVLVMVGHAFNPTSGGRSRSISMFHATQEQHPTAPTKIAMKCSCKTSRPA